MQPLRILIVGAGVAGLTAAGLLRRQGVEADLIEREPAERFNASGYMLGLLPLGGRVLNALDRRDAYLAASCQMERYRIHGDDGTLLHDYPLAFVNDRYGSYRGISRRRLIEVLLGTVDQDRIRFGTEVRAIHRDGDQAVVTTSAGDEDRYDLVIAADGLHSATRDLVLDEGDHAYRDTGWGGWVAWADPDDEPIYEEYWGEGRFLGLYPVADHLGVFVGGPVDDLQRRGRAGVVGDLADRLGAAAPRGTRALGAIAEAEDPFFWHFEDCRSSVWCRDRVILLGDAATGFLPTAGVGASMAMDSAAALVDELSRADADHLGYALDLFERRQRPRAERAQRDSRRLGQVMFLASGVLTVARNRLVPHYSLQKMLAGLSAVMEGR